MDVFKLCSVRPRWRIHYSTKKEKIQAKKTRPRKTVSSQTKRNGWFSRSNLGMYVYNDISLNVSLIRKHTVIKVERVDEWNLKLRACTVKDQRPSPKKRILRRWWKSRTSLERISIQIIKAVKLTGELNWAEFLKRLTFHGCWKDLACLQNCKGLYG